MSGKYSKFMAAAVIVSALALALPCQDAFAEQRGDGRYGGRSDRNNHGWSDGSRHYYRDGRWYRHGWFGFDTVVSALAIGALIDSLPPRHTTVVVTGTPYYYDDGYYYRPYPSGGYVVVPPPALIRPVEIVPAQVQPVPAYPAPAIRTMSGAQEISTINIPNSRGGYTSVTLRKSGNGFVGPQGEYYADNPTVEQLRVLYGK